MRLIPLFFMLVYIALIVAVGYVIWLLHRIDANVRALRRQPEERGS